MRLSFPPGTRFSAWTDGMGCVTVTSPSPETDMALRRLLPRPPTYLTEDRLGVWYVPREHMPKPWLAAARKAKSKGWLSLGADGGISPCS